MGFPLFWNFLEASFSLVHASRYPLTIEVPSFLSQRRQEKIQHCVFMKRTRWYLEHFQLKEQLLAVNWELQCQNRFPELEAAAARVLAS